MNYITMAAFGDELTKIAAIKPGLIERARRVWKKGVILPKDKRPKFEVSEGIIGSPVFKR